MKKSPQEKIDIVHKTKVISTSRDNPGLYEKPKQWDYIPHCCEKIKDIRQGKKCIFNLAAMTRKRFI